MLLQLNAEGLSKAEVEIIAHLAKESGATVILLQETHITKLGILELPGLTTAAYIHSKSMA